MLYKISYPFILLCIIASFSFTTHSQLVNHTLLITGVCRDVEKTLHNSISNIEKLGSHFADYAVVIYENNSKDASAEILMKWSAQNNKVTVFTEILPSEKLLLPRTVRIANARNCLINEIRKSKYDTFEYLMMVDLDFNHEWPIAEIIETIQSPIEWDCVSANGVISGFNPYWGPASPHDYWDRYAYRAKNFPFGPELLNQHYWDELSIKNNWFQINQSDWQPVYSAFGGLALYKTNIIRKFIYSGVVNEDLKEYYDAIFKETNSHHPQMVTYLKINHLLKNTHASKNSSKSKKLKKYSHSSNSYRGLKKIPVYFRKNCMYWQQADDPSITCCEHVVLHASMAIHGYNKFYINPKLIMRY